MSVVTSIASIVPNKSAGTKAAKAAKSAKPKTVAKGGKAKTVKAAPKSAKKQTTKAKTVTAKQTSNAKKAAANTSETKRNYGMDRSKAKELIGAKAYNGYRPGSSYGTVVESLHTLGINKFHSIEKLITAYVAETDKAALSAFKGKEKRNDTTGLGWKEKIVQNAYVTTRSDYGKRMRDIGWEVRCSREFSKDGSAEYGLFKLGKK